MKITDTKISFTPSMKVPVVLVTPEERYRNMGVKYTDIYRSQSYANGFRVSDAYSRQWIDDDEINTAEEDGVIIEHNGDLVFVRKCEAEKLGLEEVTLEKKYGDDFVGVKWEKAKDIKEC